MMDHEIRPSAGLGEMTDITAVLFDIDGTLIDMRGAGRKSFVRALKSVFGWDDNIEYINFAGNTDLNVLLQVAAHHGVTLSPAERKRFFAQLPIELKQTAAEADLVIYPGVRELLEVLTSDRRVVLGLVTGNVAASARIKLEQFGVHSHFVLGAFGDDHADRMDIARLALLRIENKMKEDQHLRACFLIGDTPADVLAAKSINAVALAVATGKFSAQDLQEAGADHVLTDLSDTQRILALMGLG
jgi:phosphoglycolate phosphatase